MATGSYHKVKGELNMKLDSNEYRKTIERLAPQAFKIGRAHV